MTDFLPVDPAGAVPVDAAGIPVRVSTSPAPAAPHVHLGGGHWAVRVPSVAGLGTGVRPARAFAGDRDISRAVALLRHRDRHLFDPADGSTLAYDNDGIRAAGASGRELYPRVDPAVIGLIRRADAEAILLGRGVDRPYFSLVAGYVDPGETLEEAFTREALRGDRPSHHRGDLLGQPALGRQRLHHGRLHRRDLRHRRGRGHRRRARGDPLGHPRRPHTPAPGRGSGRSRMR
ncbi:hypothetical protein QP028_03840 [Corynebacterium suedekumii]|nr:hypothetical protein QP028_03840 [Corynebacterium suedekumii]